MVEKNRSIMKLTATAVLILLLTTGIDQQVTLDNPGHTDSCDPEGAQLGVSFLPRAVVEGEPLSVRATIPGYTCGRALVGLYGGSGATLDLLCKTSVNVTNGSLAADYLWKFEAGTAGRYHVVVLADVYGMGNFLPGKLPRGSLDELRGRPLSGVKELFVHPRSYATISAQYEHILGSGWNSYDIRLWSLWDEGRRDDAWCALEPSALLGTIYRPAAGSVSLYRRFGDSGHFSGHGQYPVLLNGTTIGLQEIHSAGKEKVSYLIRPNLGGYQYRAEVKDWESVVTVRTYSPAFTDMRAPAIAEGGRATVTLEKRTLTLPQELFDSDMRELCDLALVRERRADFLLPSTGFAAVQTFYKVGSRAVLTGKGTLNLFGTATASVELPLAGDYFIGAAFDRDVKGSVGGTSYLNSLEGSFDVFKDLTAPGDWLVIRPERELFGPGDDVGISVSYPEGCAAGVLLYVDGGKVAETGLAPSFGLGTLSPGTHTVTAVLASDAARLVSGALWLSALDGLGWASSARVAVGSLGVTLSLPESFVGGVATQVRVVVHDGSGSPVGSADVEAVFSGYTASGYNTTSVGGTTDPAGSCVLEYVPPDPGFSGGYTKLSVNATAGGISQEVKNSFWIRRESLRGFISTDKPMYKGGDTVHSIFTVWDLDRLEPARGEALCRFISPRGRTIFQEGLELDAYGTCRMDLPVGSEMAWGMHTLELRFDGTVLARSGVIIKPYTLPLTRLTLDAGGDTVSSGERLSVSAYAEYTLFSAPVGNGTVSYNITALSARTGQTFGTYAPYRQEGDSYGQGQEQGQAQGQEQGQAQGQEQGQAQDQGQGQGQDRSQGRSQAGEGPVAEPALEPVISEEEYIDRLVPMFSWTGGLALDHGQGWINLTVPPLADALRVSAVFQDELDHRNEETLVLHVGERPAFVENALSVTARKSAFSAGEPAGLEVRSLLPGTPAVLSVRVADASGAWILAGERHVVTGADGWRNLSLQELFIDVRGLLERGYHSYVVSARFLQDPYPRSNAVFTVHRYAYEALSERTVYRGGETVRLDLSIEDVTDPLGPESAGRDERFLVRLEGACGRAMEVPGTTRQGVAGVELPLPADAAAGLWTVVTVFESAVVRNTIEVLGPAGIRFDASLAGAGADCVRVSLGFGVSLEGTVFLDARDPAGCVLREFKVRGAAEVSVPRPDRFRPLTVLAYSFTPDGLKTAVVVVPPDRRELSVGVSTDRPTYEPGETVNVTLTTSGPALVYFGIVSNALFYGIPTVEEDWFREDLGPAATVPAIESGWARARPAAGELSRLAVTYHPSARTCPLPYSPSWGQPSQGGNGGSYDGNGGGVGQGQGQGQGQSNGGAGGAVQEVNEFVPRDLEMGGDMRSDIEGLRMRRWFTDAAYWTGGIPVSGSTTLTVVLPDNVRTWRITAVGLTDRCFGDVAVAKFNVKKPFYVEMRLPSTLTQDDEVVFKALVYNFHSHSLRAKVGFYAGPWLQVFGENEKWLDMEPESVYSVQFQVKVASAGRQNLSLLATDFRGSRDGVFAELDVKANTVESRTELAGVVEDGLGFSVAPEAFSVPELFSARLSVAFRYEGLVMEGLESMCRYPYGCNEQTMTCLLPNILVWRYLENLDKLTPALRAELTKNILHGVEKLLYTQHEDGGWGWYKEDRTHSFMTAWILYGLAIVDRGGFFIDPGVLHDGQQALLNMMNHDGGWTGTKWMVGRDVAMSAFCVLALAASGYPGPLMDLAVSHLQALWVCGKVQGAYEAALISLALSEAHLPGDPMAGWLVGEMRDDHWEGNALGGNTETTGWATLALLKAGMFEPAQRPLKWLVARRSGYGWGGTSSTMAVLLAFDEATQPGCVRDSRPGNITLFVDGKEVRHWSSGTGTTPVDLRPYVWPDGAEISFRNEGHGNAYYKYTQVDQVRPPVTVTFTGDITTTTGKVFELAVRATVDRASACRIGLANLDASLPVHPDLQTVVKTARDEAGEVTVRMVALRPGTYRLMPLVVSYQFSGNGGKSSLVREYLGPVTVRAGDVARALTQEVSIEKTVDPVTVDVGGTANVTLTVRAWGSAIGRTAEVRDFLPGSFTKLQPDELDMVSGVGEPGAGVELRYPHEKRWRFALPPVWTVTYEILAVGDFRGEMGKAAVLMDGYLVNLSGRPAIGTGRSGMFVSRDYSAASLALGETLVVTLRFGSTAGLDFYVAVEDTLPPGFEADRDSLEACVRGEVQSYCVRGDKITFFVNSLGSPMSLAYRALAGMHGTFVAPPAKLFPMYSSENVAYSGSSGLVVTDSDGVAQDGEGGFEPQKAPAAAPAERREPLEPGETEAETSRPAGPVEDPEEPETVLPDIRVDRIRTLGELRIGEAVLFVAEVAMTGFGAEIPLTVRAYIDGRQVKEESLRLSGPEYSLNVHFGWVATPGPHVVRVAADPLGWVNEQDESNNVLESGIYIQWPAETARQTASPWQAGLLALDALVCFVLTARLAGPVARRLERRRERQRAASSGQKTG